MGNKIIKSETKIEDYVDVKSNLDSDYKSHVYDDNDNNDNNNNNNNNDNDNNNKTLYK